MYKHGLLEDQWSKVFFSLLSFSFDSTSHSSSPVSVPAGADALAEGNFVASGGAGCVPAVDRLDAACAARAADGWAVRDKGHVTPPEQATPSGEME